MFYGYSSSAFLLATSEKWFGRYVRRGTRYRHCGKGGWVGAVSLVLAILARIQILPPDLP